MTIKEIKDYYLKHLNIKLKSKSNFPDNYEITNIDIKNGDIFLKYTSGETIAKTVNGFTIIGDNIYYAYVDIDNIEILVDELFPPCGGNSKVTVNANYSIKALNNNNEYITIKDNLYCPVNALITLDNPIFTYEKPYIINESPNYSDSNKEVNVNASYYYNGIKYNASKHITQRINFVSSWLVEEEPTQFISLSFDKNVASNKGDVVTAKVERYFSRIYYMKDSCGNKVGGKCEPDLIEDITSKCLITSSNKKNFNVAKNIITVSKQEVGALKRKCEITARYLEHTTTEILTQEEGVKISYSYELSFIDGNKTKLLDLGTSLPTEIKVNIKSKKHRYIDEEHESISNTNEISIESDSKWVNAICGEDDGSVYILVKVNEINKDKEDSRQAVLTIKSTADPDLCIELGVIQPPLEVYKEEYCCDFNGNGEYTSNELDNTNLYFHPYKVLVFENGDREVVEIEELNLMSVKWKFNSTDDRLLSVLYVKRNGEDFSLHLNNSTRFSIKDITLNGNLMFYLDGKKLFESQPVNIIVKGNKIIEYNYELCFNEHNKYKIETWFNSSEPKYIHVNSLKHKLVNGERTESELVPYRISTYDSDGKEIFDDTFSIKILNDKIIVFPVKIDENVERTYVITQNVTKDKISFKLSYKNKLSIYKIPLKVIVHCSNIGSDIWTGENGYMLIDNDINIKLKPCWLSPNMKDNIDIAYNGTVELTEGIHTFETFNVLLLNYDKTHEYCNIKKEINIYEGTESIVISIEI